MTVSPFGCFHYTFVNGSAAQHSDFTKALNDSLFDFSRVPADVEVEWVSDPSVHLHNETAETHWDVPVLPDASSAVTMKIKDTFAPVDNNEDYRVQTILHELGHVVQSRFNTKMRDDMAKLFRKGSAVGDADHWKAADYDTGTNTWKNSIQEAFADTFSVIYSKPEAVSFQNRSSWLLPEEKHEDFFKVLDLICCPVIFS